MKNVVVSGGCGFIGSHIVDRLCRRADINRIVVVDNLWTGIVENLESIADCRVEFVEQDVEKYKADIQIDEVYHLASPASPSWYMTDPLRTISANVVGAMNLLEQLAPAGLFCYTSTSEVYGDPLVSPQPESYRGSVDCTGPRSSYDESKRCTEAMLFESRRVHGTRIKVARLFNVFGPRTRPDDGRAISNFIVQALRGENITIYGDGLQSRSWGYVDDIVDALERYFWLDGSDYAGPLNIGNDREIAVVDVARYIQNKFERSELTFLPPVPQDPTNRRPDLELCKKIVPDWACKVPYEEGVDLTLSWFRQRLEAEKSPSD
jgi:UDP-glucose 4-epimerase/UDP-glucuronate decarboxylase